MKSEGTLELLPRALIARRCLKYAQDLIKNYQSCLSLSFGENSERGEYKIHSWIESLKADLYKRSWPDLYYDCMVKARPQFPGEKTPGAKVEGGTGFKPLWRHRGVYQRTVWGKASSCCESKGGSRKWIRVKPGTPETPQAGEIVRNPKEGSTH